MITSDVDAIGSHWREAKMFSFSNWHKSTAEADGNVISCTIFLFGHKPKVLGKVKFWPDDGTTWKVKGSPKVLQLIVRETILSVPNFMALHPVQYLPQSHKGQPHGGARWKVRGCPKSLEFIIWEPSMSAQSFVSIYLVDIEMFNWVSTNFYLLDKKSEYHSNLGD